MSERDICTKFITPNLVTAGWDINTQIREEVGFTDGRMEIEHSRTHAAHLLQAVLKEAFAPASGIDDEVATEIWLLNGRGV